jgi:hypothetical protein
MFVQPFAFQSRKRNLGPSLYSIGQTALGGAIAYILQSGDPGYSASVQKGYVVTLADVSAGVQWGCNFSAISGADGTALGTGKQNTTDIVSQCGQTGAASLARAVNDGGYNDWFLPNSSEMIEIIKSAGFRVSEKIDLVSVGKEYQYLFLLTK